MTQKRILELAKIGARTVLADLIKASLNPEGKLLLREEKRQAFKEYDEIRRLLVEEEENF